MCDTYIPSWRVPRRFPSDSDTGSCRWCWSTALPFHTGRDSGRTRWCPCIFRWTSRQILEDRHKLRLDIRPRDTLRCLGRGSKYCSSYWSRKLCRRILSVRKALGSRNVFHPSTPGCQSMDCEDHMFPLKGNILSYCK